MQKKKPSGTELRKVYFLVKQIKKGKTATYKHLAIKLNTSPRAIGQALKKNFNKKVPCHRVIKSDGSLGGYNRGIRNKKQLLIKEGIKNFNSKSAQL